MQALVDRLLRHRVATTVPWLPLLPAPPAPPADPAYAAVGVPAACHLVQAVLSQHILLSEPELFSMYRWEARTGVGGKGCPRRRHGCCPGHACVHAAPGFLAPACL